MTIAQALAKINALKPNTYTDEDKIGWLSELDWHIKIKIIDTHENTAAAAFDGYTGETSHATQLLVPAPFDQMYLFWLESKIDYWNGEMGKYNNSISMYNTAYAEYEKYYNRNNMPKGRKLKFF